MSEPITSAATRPPAPTASALSMHELEQLIYNIEWRGVNPDLCSRLEIHHLLLCAKELKIWREGSVTEDLLRRHNGYLRIGRGCVVVPESSLASNLP